MNDLHNRINHVLAGYRAVRAMSDYTAFLALVRNGFRPPTGAGRCRRCACHVATQGHRDGCPERGK